MTALPASLAKPPFAGGSRKAPLPDRRGARAARLWWELIAGPGPLPVRLLRWAERNAVAEGIAPTRHFR